MCLAAGREILFYTSPNLKDWTHAGSFAPQQIPRAGVLETPDLFELPLGDTRQTRWVLTLGINAGAPAGGSGCCYFVGRFDGRTFAPKTFGWMDYGADFYAPQTWSNAPDARRICLGWMNNWQYATATPASEWRGMFSIPRELRLVESEAGISLAQTPIVEVNAWRRETFAVQGRTFQPGEYPLNGEPATACEAMAEITVGAASRFGFRIQTGADESILVLYDKTAHTLSVNRSHSGQADFHKDFGAMRTVALPGGERVSLRILLDTNSVEVFAQDGRVVLSECIFGAGQAAHWTFFVAGGALTVDNLQIFAFSTEVA
jgi:sucrose-6-phosphate hydrolase SacC (GH32 family)